jgi:hypothetical protein
VVGIILRQQAAGKIERRVAIKYPRRIADWKTVPIILTK